MVCPRCVKKDTMAEVHLSGKGKIDTFSTCFAALPGFPAPTIQGYINLEEGARIWSLITGTEPSDAALKIGMDVELVIEKLRGDAEGNEIMSYKFRPVKSIRKGKDNMRDVVIIGVGMTRFGKFLERSMQDLGREAVWNAIEDANISAQQVQIAYVASSLAYQLTELKGTIGQHVLGAAGFFGIPMINVENACSSGSTALRNACLEVASGSYDIALALGVEKLFCADTAKSAQAMASGTPYAKFGFMFPALYAMNLKKWMEKYSITQQHFAKVAVKNSKNGSLNPNAQFENHYPWRKC